MRASVFVSRAARAATARSAVAVSARVAPAVASAAHVAPASAWRATAAAAAASRAAAAAAASRTSVQQAQVRAFATGGALTEAQVEERVINTIKNFEKIGESVSVTGTSHFLQDLGLDSLDTVELIMAVEDEFAIEIPDSQLESLHTTSDVVKFVLSHPQAK